MPSNETPKTAATIKRQQARNIGFAVVGLVIVIVVCLWVGERTKGKEEGSVATGTLIESGVDAVEDELIWLQRAENKLETEKQRGDTFAQKIEKLQQDEQAQQVLFENQQVEFDKLVNKITAMEAALNKPSKDSPHNSSEPTEWGGLTHGALNSFPVPPKNAFEEATFQQPFAGIHTETLALTPTHNQAASSALLTAENYLPAGSIVKAVLLGGLDAGAGVNAQAEPRPVVLRVVEEGRLPNQGRSHLKDCVLMGAGFGDISSERAYIRLERLSCTEPSGEILEVPAYGYVSGPDGKVGVRGRAVWREGAPLKRSFISGLFSGMSKGLADSLTTTSISPLGATKTLDSGDVFKSGLATGGTSALERLANYHIQRAEQYQPIIQINAGITVDVVFHTGVSLAKGQVAGFDTKVKKEEKRS